MVNCTFCSERLHVMQHMLTNAVYQTEVFCICQTKVSRNGHMKQQFEEYFLFVKSLISKGTRGQLIVARLAPRNQSSVPASEIQC